MDTILIIVLVAAAVCVAIWGWRKSLKKASQAYDSIKDELDN